MFGCFVADDIDIIKGIRHASLFADQCCKLTEAQIVYQVVAGRQAKEHDGRCTSCKRPVDYIGNAPNGFNDRFCMGYRTGLLDIILEVPHELAHACNFAPVRFEERIFVDAITVGDIIAEGIIEDTLFGPEPFVLAWPPVKKGDATDLDSFGGV